MELNKTLNKYQPEILTNAQNTNKHKKTAKNKNHQQQPSLLKTPSKKKPVFFLSRLLDN
jgi:hypothetical protein